MFKEIYYAGRSLWQRPGFALVAVLTLALGIGANTAIFSLVNTVLLRSLAVERPDEVVVVGLPALEQLVAVHWAMADGYLERVGNLLRELTLFVRHEPVVDGGERAQPIRSGR